VLGAVALMHFCCDECGNLAVELPKVLDEGALVLCWRCRKALCTWAEFKDRARQVIGEDRTRAQQGFQAALQPNLRGYLK
jgi:hypothetical protein